MNHEHDRATMMMLVFSPIAVSMYPFDEVRA
jgi:hypothetical protein